MEEKTDLSKRTAVVVDVTKMGRKIIAPLIVPKTKKTPAIISVNISLFPLFTVPLIVQENAKVHKGVLRGHIVSKMNVHKSKYSPKLLSQQGIHSYIYYPPYFSLSLWHIPHHHELLHYVVVHNSRKLLHRK